MSALYDEVLANLTWYELNSEYNDPMYQYMYKLERDIFAKVNLPLLITNYTTQEDFVLLDRTKIPRYGTYECSAPEKEAYMDSALSCFLFQLPFFLEKIQIGFIGLAFVIPIILISIFGGIKDSYRFFILNQAIWDLFLCYDFICSRPTLYGWSKNYHSEKTCFYSMGNANANGSIKYILMQGFQLFLRNSSFIPVFHLALSRFLAMYFSRFYKSFTKNGYKILIFILAFNIICIAIFCCGNMVLTTFLSSVLNESEEKCGPLCPSRNATYCIQNIPKYFQCRNRINLKIRDFDQQKGYKILRYIHYPIPTIMFLLSIICAGFLFYKIASQLKFQLKTNFDSFKQTIKISSVVGFQCLTMSVIFVITGIQKFLQVKREIAGTLNVYNDLPPWLFLLQYITTTASLNMIRIILDSCIILTVLTGYSKCVVFVFKFAYLCLTNPKKAYNRIKSNLNGDNVTIISAVNR